MVDKDELEELKKLPPEERLKKLKEFEKRNKEEIEAAQKMIKLSEHELHVEEELKDIPIPEAKEVNISELFTASDEDTLEQTVSKEAVHHAESQQYDQAIEEAQQLVNTLTNAYGTIKELVSEVYQGTISEENAARLQSYQDAAKKLYEAGIEPNEEFNQVINEADRLLHVAYKQMKGESGLRDDYIL